MCYAQSGGVTAVINATAAAVLDAAEANPNIGRVFAAKNGILGVLEEEYIQTWRETKTSRALLPQTPGGAFGSCRIKLPPPPNAKSSAKELAVYRRIVDSFSAHDIGHFLYNGGNDSADTAQKIAAAARWFGVSLSVAGIPKTIDNDLAATDSCPGFGSAAKYIAVSVAETALDVASMARTSTKVFVLEVMGRNAGWLAAAAGLAIKDSSLMILPPENLFRRAHFISALRRRVREHGYVSVVVAEGLRDGRGNLMSAAESADAFSHRQLGGVASRVAEVAQSAGYKCHWAVADYLQRAAAHIASATDVSQAAALGRAAVSLVASGKSGKMPVIKRVSDSPYRWRVDIADLKKVANVERRLPSNYLRQRNLPNHPGLPPLSVAVNSGRISPPLRPQRPPQTRPPQKFTRPEKTSALSGIKEYRAAAFPARHCQSDRRRMSVRRAA